MILEERSARTDRAHCDGTQLLLERREAGVGMGGGGVEKKMRKREGSKKVKRKSEDEKR